VLPSLELLKLLALHIAFKGEVSERRPELIDLPAKHAKVGLYRRGTGKDGGDAITV
jgi:hypothetical protein